jgi:hypothetical protein
MTILTLVCTNRRCGFKKAKQDFFDVSKCPECGSELEGLHIPLPRERPILHRLRPAGLIVYQINPICNSRCSGPLPLVCRLTQGFQTS